MRTVYITTGYGKVSMTEPGLPEFGLDLYAEIEPGKWVHADHLPDGYLTDEKNRGTLQHGIAYQGRVYSSLNVEDTLHKLIASKNGLQLRVNEYKGGSTAFKAQVGNPLEQLSKQIEGLQQKLQELRVLDTEAKAAELEALKSRLKRAKRIARTLKEDESKEQIKPEDVEPHPLDIFADFRRATRGNALSTEALEMLAKAERVTEYVDESNDLLMDPRKIAQLRNMLLQ